ncbi:PREDICTED: acetylcholine receptor subunit beta-type unc-29-like [Priapulus caudatus]|uniref:Acetylcholine receptor subunit beta-type unc-29-like n=1 Tax=Priapulus caudatus TaxID=37621 RepID=A0ABM1E2W4_PRICU|nr:PREDICTED: acetylcholine receptor subunit beta-type unc-29-like [Priapulus caudatus]
MALIQIVNVLWHDYQLTWDPADYEGVNSLRVSPAKVWLPDIVLFNNADGNYEVSYKCNVVLFPDGSVLWVPPAIFQSSCTINVEYFPFDMQTCEMNFGSWTFNKDQVKLSFYEGKDHVDLNDYQESVTWDIIELPGCIDNEHSKSATMTFHISIRRRALFYTINLMEGDDVLLTGKKEIIVTKEGRKTMSAIDYIAERLRAEDTVQEIKDDWQYIAMVIDRLLLYVFFAVTASGAISIILKAPDIFDDTIESVDYC